MIWITTAIYSLLCSALLWIGFWLYGKALVYLGRSGVVIKSLGGFVVYMLFACVLVSPFFLAPVFIENWRDEVKSNVFYFVYFGICYLISVAPGGFYFRKRYLIELKEFGYFAKRR